MLSSICIFLDDKKTIVAVWFIVGIALLIGCRGPLIEADEVRIISDIAYDVNPNFGYTVFIMEGGEVSMFLI
jgi:hypothetical protein